MDRIKEATAIVEELNKYFANEITDYEFIKKVCLYFDKVKNLNLSSSDLKFLKYISNIVGVPHYYDLLFSKFKQLGTIDNYDLNTISAMIYESSLHIDENIKIHKFQKQVLKKFTSNTRNRFFLSATTSFGKTFLIYEIMKKMQYNNIALIFPTIALLSENYERIFTDENYSYFSKEFGIHTLSEIHNFSQKNIYIFTPERYLSFIDKHKNINLDFVFVDEIYKIDNEFLIDTINKENERDTAYRVALQNILKTNNDIFLVGPYIEIPDKNDNNLNQSFNLFLHENGFEIINFNNYEIVSKSSVSVTNKDQIVDSELSLTTKGCNSIKNKASKIISDIRGINDNAIIYTKGAGTAESQASSICKNPDQATSEEIHKDLYVFLQHLKNTFKHEDWIIIKSLEKKIGIHHGLVPKYIQKEIIKFFNQGYLDVLVSTTTITEGVNTSAKNLIILSALKGTKPLKKFDAKNIAGRAGRFLHHYTGRVLIIDPKFKEIIDGADSEIKHKNYDSSSIKNEIDYFITEEKYLNQNDIINKKRVLVNQLMRDIPDEIMIMYKVISRSDKMTIFDNIRKLSPNQHSTIKDLIIAINRNLSVDYDGFKIVLNIIREIITNESLKFLIDNESQIKKGKNIGKSYPIIIYMVSAYLEKGFFGSIEYNLSRKEANGKKFTIDKAIRESSHFIFNTLKYQLVKYLGVFNLMYKYERSIFVQKPIEEITGIDRLLLKLEYNATTDKGRLASDYGVPGKIVEYYENDENKQLISLFDAFETIKFQQIEKILNNVQKTIGDS